MILGSDSHTRYGALGTLAIGEGGGELAKQLVGQTYDIETPKVVLVYVHGKVKPGVGPHDVALALCKETYANGFVKNRVMEFVGEGIHGLSQEYRNAIDVMTTETTCLSSIWETDAKGTVDDRTVTGIEEQLNKEGETADSVTKTATEGTKEFYTISTKSGKIFYLIIDNSKSQDNVYFLTEVSEKDLMNFTLSDSVTLPEVDTVYAEPEKKVEEEKPETTETAEKDKVEDDIQMPEDKSPFGTYLLIALVAVGAAAGGYYFKVYKPKHEYDDEDEMEEDEDESEDSESEKREVDDADEQEESTEPEILRDEDFDDNVLEDEEEEQE